MRKTFSGVPVLRWLVWLDGQIVGEGWNQSISGNDPSARRGNHGAGRDARAQLGQLSFFPAQTLRHPGTLRDVAAR